MHSKYFAESFGSFMACTSRASLIPRIVCDVCATRKISLLWYSRARKLRGANRFPLSPNQEKRARWRDRLTSNVFLIDTANEPNANSAFRKFHAMRKERERERKLAKSRFIAFYNVS